MKPLVTYALRIFSTLYPPQKPLLFVGADSSRNLAELLAASGHRRPLIVTDGFLFSSGMLDSLIRQLEADQCQVSVFDEIIPNPTVAVVEAGVRTSKVNACDCVVAVGGGSTIDAAKVIAAASVGERDVADLEGLLKVKTPPLPFYAVPTTSGTGSETTTAAVLSDSENHAKKFFVDPKYIPRAAALDPNLLKSLPAGMTAATGMDALTHAIEAFTSLNRFEDTDSDARLAVKLLFDFLPVVYDDGSDLKAREKVALASYLAGYAFTKSSLGYVHAISHQITACYNTPHGLANAVLLPRVLRFNLRACAERLAELEIVLGGDPSGPTDVLARRFIERVDELSDRVGIPRGLDDLDEVDFPAITKRALAEARRSYAVPRKMRRRDVEAILTSVVEGNAAVRFE